MHFAMFSTLVLMAVSAGHMAHAVDFKVVDLTHNQDLSTIYWPGNPDYNFTILYRKLTAQGYWYESNAFQTAEHGGTHMDAPSHFAEGKYRQHQIPMKKLVGPGVIINITSKAAENPDYRVTIDDLRAWEAKYNSIPKGAVIIMNSGWSLKYPNKALTFGTETPDDASTFHFPGWHEDTVNWLIKNKDVHVVGVDTPSIDYGQSTTFPVHVTLGEANVPGVENVSNLEQIPENGTIIYVAAIKLYDGSGGPARVFATIAKDGMTNCSSDDDSGDSAREFTTITDDEMTGCSSALTTSSAIYVLSIVVAFGF